MADSLDALLNPGLARHGRRAGSITSVPTSSSSSYDSSPSFGRKPSLGMGLPSTSTMSMGMNSGPSSGSSSFNPSPVLSRTTSRPNSKGPTIGDLDTTPSFASSITTLGSTLPTDREGSAGRRGSALTGRRAGNHPSLASSLTSPLSDEPESANNISGSSAFSPSVSVPPRRSISSREAASASASAATAPLPAAPSVMAPSSTSSAEPATYRSSLYATTKDNKENNSAQINPPSQPANDTPEYTPSVGKRWGSLTSRMQPAEDGSKNGKGLAPLDALASSSSSSEETPIGSDGKRAAPLFGCPDCGRQFKRQALIVHQRSCKKVQSKRETFNTSEKRLQDVLEQDKQLASTTPAFDKDRYQEDAAQKAAEKKGKKEKEPRGSIKEKILAAQKAKETSVTAPIADERPFDVDIPASSTTTTTTKAAPPSSAAATAAEKAAEAEKKATWRAESLKLREEMKNAKKMYNGGAGSMGIDMSRMLPKF